MSATGTASATATGEPETGATAISAPATAAGGAAAAAPPIAAAEERAERLRAAGLRVTAPRVAVLGVLDEARPRHEHLTAATILERSRDREREISTQGVYDCLDVLATAGLVRRIEPAGQPALYESRVRDNHHHLVCRSCGRVVDVDCVVGEAACLVPSSTSGFVVDEAEVTFWGRCVECVDALEP